MDLHGLRRREEALWQIWRIASAGGNILRERRAYNDYRAAAREREQAEAGAAAI